MTPSKQKQHESPKPTTTPAQTAEAERTREGSDNPAAIQAKMDAAVAPAAAAVATPAPTQTKQQKTLEELKAAWVKRGVDLSKMTTAVDGKFLNVNVGEGWPLIVIGPTGGINLPQIRSYSSALNAAINGDTAWARQQERDAKKAAPVVAKITAHVTPAAQPEAKAVTPTQKKTKAHEAIESRMA